MSNVALISPHQTREDMYHEALEDFLRTSAAYLDLDVPTAGEREDQEPLAGGGILS